jgi:cbb3-type cytochrome oxidase maturation protein
MSVLVFLIPIALTLGGAGLAAFFWALKSGQFEDPKGAAERVLLDDDLEDNDQDAARMSR